MSWVSDLHPADGVCDMFEANVLDCVTFTPDFAAVETWWERAVSLARGDIEMIFEI